MEAYCFGCRKKTEMDNPSLEEKKTSRGLKRFYKGTCSVCGKRQSVMTR